MNLDNCKYCRLSPVDLHHLLPRSDFPTLTYHPENVVPLCIQTHGLITRKKWSSDLREKYVSAIRMWRAADEGKKADVFNQVMDELITASMAI